MGRDRGLNERADLQRTGSKAIAGIGRVVLWNGGSLWIGRAAGLVQGHAHHAIQISLALTGCVRFRASEQSNWTDYSAAMVLPHHRHEFDGNGEAVAQLFVEPETAQGRVLLERYRGKAVVALEGELFEQIRTSLRGAYETRLKDAAMVGAGQHAVGLISGADPALRVDPRITKAIEWMAPRLGSSVTLTEAARVAHLSPGRFRHLFVAQTGISFRAYVLWARVKSAVGAAMGGMSWTEAAQAWGFADSAHLSRTCRRMFGIAPSSLLREERN